MTTFPEAASAEDLALEREKLMIERERMMLERERLESQRASLHQDQLLQIDGQGKIGVSVASVILLAILCLLLGGVLGSYTAMIRQENRMIWRRQAVMKAFAGTSTNTFSPNEIDFVRGLQQKQDADGNVFLFLE